MIRKKNNLDINNSGRNLTRVLWLLLLVFMAAISMELSIPSAAASSKRPKMTPDHQEFYNYARYLFTKNEKKIFHNLTTDEARERFIENFWEIRDPTPFTPDNEFKLEMEQRYEYVSKYLKEGPIPGWETDRGRIYLMLGPPSEHQLNVLRRSTVIQWYYDEYNVYILFYDDNGNGVFRMDLTSVSLTLLDVLDNKKYFIVDKEGKIKWETLDIDINYDSKTRGFLVKISTKNLDYEKVSENSAEMMAKIKVDLVVYRSDKPDDFSRYSEVKSVKVPKEKLLEKNAFISLAVPLELPTGKIKIDAIISDALGDAVYRKFISLNVKKGG
jgi:GWxTD domain-containing protein